MFPQFVAMARMQSKHTSDFLKSCSLDASDSKEGAIIDARYIAGTGEFFKRIPRPN